jgi:hypothetical protein
MKAGITEAPKAPKAPEEFVASATSINQAVAAAGNFPKTTEEVEGEAVAAAGSFPETTEEAEGEAMAAAGSFSETTEEAGSEAVATSSGDATQALVLAERKVTMQGGKPSFPEKEAPAETETASPFYENRLPIQGCHIGRLSGKSHPKDVVRVRPDERPSRPTAGRGPRWTAPGGWPRRTAPAGQPVLWQSAQPSYRKTARNIITFFSPLQGSPSSTVAPRVIPQSYFLL